MKYWQQGDVLLRPVEPDAIPEGRAVKPVDGSLILAHGEATGHAHRISAMDGLTLIDARGKMFLRAGVPFTILHEEHGPIELPPGGYKVSRVLEYDYWAERTREVAD
ncbi:MAG: hypothetical protein NTX64_03380 [Elusimicrobia bacterium]|nr:hypothetical protein [Elusimicrobiota bacterium]